MGNGCAGLCRKKVAPEPIKAKVETNLEIKPTATPQGCCILYAGVRTDDNKNTCPILSVRTWHKSMQNMKKEWGTLHTAGTTGGYSFQGNRESTMITNAKEKVEFKVGFDQQILVIPIEDIIRIKISTEAHKEVVHTKTAHQKHKPAEELGTCQKLKKCCVKNVFCCCYKEEVQAPEYEVSMNQKEEATRSITVTIEYVRYGLIDTPSNVRVLSEEKQAEFYNKHLEVDKIQFYYLNSKIFDETEYNRQLEESEALARIVMQLKSMNNHYPDEPKLQQIIQQHYLHHFGQQLTEEIPMLKGVAETTTVISRPTRQNQLTSS